MDNVVFLKSDGEEYGSTIFEYFHEGPEIIKIDDELDLLLGLRARASSKDDYPRPVYEAGDDVRMGDFVQIKLWVQFWKGWQNGIVIYVPGVSSKKLCHESEGLKLICIKFKDGEVSRLVDPTTGILKSVRLINVGTSKMKIQPNSYQLQSAFYAFLCSF